MLHLPQTRMLRDSQRTARDKVTIRDNPALHAGVTLLVWLTVFLVGLLMQKLMQMLVFWISPSLKETHSLMVQLFSTAATIAVCCLYCRFAEKRSLLSLGFVKKGFAVEYAAGLGIGLVLFGVAVALCVATGNLTLSVNTAPAVGMIFLYFLGYTVQGMSEEILCRGYLMVSLQRGCPLWMAVLTNALIFTILHLGNPGVTPLALVNLTLFGIFASLYTLRRGSIWGISAIHTTWNFAQGNIFGIQVSGLTGNPSLLTATVSEDGNLIHGGAFGMEGGLAVTVVLAVGCGVMMVIKTKKSEIAESSLVA